jgi:hypothetical protein
MYIKMKYLNALQMLRYTRISYLVNYKSDIEFNKVITINYIPNINNTLTN